jgi:signal transduction histidine kinase
MDLIFLTHAAIVGATLLLGVLVYLTNRRRVANVYLMVMSFVLVAWLSCLVGAFESTNPLWAVRYIRMANALGAAVPFLFNGLRLSIVHRNRRFPFILRQTRIWLLLAIVVMLLCTTDFFLVGVTMHAGSGGVRGIPEPIYGPGILLYGVYQVASLGVFLKLFIGGLRRASGITRVELQFMLLASAAAIVWALLVTVILPIVMHSSQVVRLAPVAILLFVGIIAYGIATRRIMGVGYVLRALTAYALLAVYIGGVYMAVFFGLQVVLRLFAAPSLRVAHFFAAMAMAFSMTPAHWRSRRVADRLFVNMPSTDMARVVEKTSAVLQTIGTLPVMLGRFAGVLRELVACENVVVLLRQDDHFRQSYPLADSEADHEDRATAEAFDDTGLAFEAGDPLPARLGAMGSPIVLDVIYRRTPSPGLAGAGEQLRQLGMAAAIGIRAKGSLRGVILVGPRLFGGVYGSPEQRAMQAAADQLAVAIENAMLYTRLEDSKIYSDTLVDNLVTGVIAVDRQSHITTFNREAERLTGRLRAQALDHTVDVLPPALARLLRETLRFGSGIRNRDVTLPPCANEESIPVRAGTGIFHGRTGGISGALLVFSDMSAVRKLEDQVRRTTHLASVGTLAGGMAHEIKNPLVTLKTFSQLLKERYDDAEFRDTFVDLVGSEVNRIDTIVNQLLRFGKPADAVLRPSELIPEIRESLRLVSGETAKKNIAVKLHTTSDTVVINGDPRLLQQAFVNFFLNAVDAMSENGTLTVTAEIVMQPPIDSFPDLSVLQDRQVRVTIRDTGKGIAAAVIARVFDPFYTTKAAGTGLGLSVAHGIIREHKGIIDVESTEGVGTAFVVSFPLLRDQHASYMRHAGGQAGGNDSA